MKEKKETGAKIPAYLQLYLNLREKIISGVYPYGTRLPSRRVAAAENAVSTITAEHAYALLCDEGYAEARERSGYFVIFRVSDGFSMPPENTPAAAKNTRKNPPPQAFTEDSHTAPEESFPISVLAKSMRRVISEREEELLSRSPNTGLLSLREAIARYLARSRGIRVAPEQLVIGSGSEYLYGLLIQLLGRDRIYALESPSYEKIEQVYQAAGTVYEMLPLGSDGIESEALHSAKAAVLHITPYRSYPSGVTASASKRHEYLRWAEQGDRYLIEDDFESEFSVSRKPEETLFSHAAKENVIYMNSFSRTISFSVRLAYLVLPPALTERFAEKLGFYSCTVPTFIQYLVAELIDSGDFERHINRVRRQKRKLLAENPEISQ